MPKVLGDVAIVISPVTVGFRREADALLRKDLAGFRPKIQLGVDTKDSARAVADLKARMEAMRATLAKMRADVNTKAAEVSIARLQARLSSLVKTSTNITMGVDSRKFDAAIAAELAKVARLRQQMSKLQIDADSKRALSKIANLEKEAFHLQDQLDKGIELDVDVKAAEARLRAIDAELRVLNDNARTIQIKADRRNLSAAIAASEAEVLRLRREAADISIGGNVDIAKLLGAESALLGIEAVVEKLGARDAPVANTAMNAFFRSTRSGTTAAAAGWRLLTGHITLFGGALNSVLPKMFTSVAVWHLLADAVIELVAVWVPAIIAVTAFGVAGVDAGKKIYQRMQAVHTVMDATGQAVPPLTNNFKHLAAAVRPEVYQLFGDALVIMSKRGGAFNQVAIGTGRVLDQLAARFVVAITSGSGVNKFMEHATEDVAKLGDSIGNFGGIFGAVFRAVPGYAEILLTVGDAITRVLEAATQAAEPIIAVGLALHGFFIYGGAAVTLTFALVGGMVKLFGAFGKFNSVITLVGLNALRKFALGMVGVIKIAAGWVVAMFSLAASDGVAAASMYALSEAAAVLSKVPIMVWITLAATLLAGLAIAIARSKDAAQEFNGTMQDLIANASLGNVVTTIQSAQAATAARLAETTGRLNKAIRENTVVFAGRAGVLNSNGTAIQNLSNAQRHYADGQAKLDAQSALVNKRFSILSKTYGGNAQALGILSAAGITTTQITDKSANAWAIIQVQVEATTRAYKAMGSQAGVIGNDLDVMGRTLTDLYQAVQKLNQGWSAFITDVTGTQGAFDTVAQGFFTLQDHAGKLTFSLGKLKIKYADQKAAIDSLTPAGIALNQAFGEQVQNVDKLFASWRTAGISGKQFTSGVQAAIGPLVKYAAGSQEATAQLVALAEEAGYQGPVSLAALTKWLGNTHGATKRLKDITDQATVQEALLTGAMQDQGKFISGQLLNDINQAILSYHGVADAVAAYGAAVARSGKGSDIAKAKMTQAIAAIVQAESDMGDNTRQMAAVVAKTFGVDMPTAMNLVKQALASTVSKLPAQQRAFETFAINSLGLTADKAGEVWKAFGRNNMNALITQVDSSRSAFDKFAAKGLGISADAADKLWLHLRRQYLDTLGAKGDITRGKFIKLAMDGLDLSRTAAQKLWDTLHRQQLVDAANKAGETKTQFEHLASQLGVTKGYADRLWDSLHKVSKGSPYFVVIREKGTGLFTITGPGIKASQGKGGSGNAAGGLAYGGYIDVGAGPVADDVLVRVSRGELVVPANMVDAGAVDHLRGMLPGFARGGRAAKDAAIARYGRYASGGMVPDGGLASLAGATTNFHADFYSTMTSAMKAAMTRALIAARNAAQAAAQASFGPGSGALGGDARANKVLALSMFPWPSSMFGAFDYLEMREAGYNRFARNPSSGAYGMPQALPPTKMPFAAQAAGGSHAGPQLSWMYGYIHDRYGNPVNAANHERVFNWYARGGRVRKLAAGGLIGMASGGRIPLSKYLPQLRKAQGGEYGDYAGLRKAYLADIAHARTGSWTSGHKAGIRSELATLAKYQSLEEAAYDNILHHGTARANLSKFSTRIKAVTRTSRDKDLSHSHPGWSHGLQYWLGVLTHLAQADVAPVYGGSQAKLQFPAWLARARTAQAHEVYDFRGLEGAFQTGLAHARKGTWLYQNRKALGERLYAVAVRQNAEAAAYSDLIRHSSGSVSDLGGLSGRIGKLGSRARAEAGSLQPALLGHLPGGHPGWVKALQAQLRILSSLSASPPFNPPWAPGNLGPSHTAVGGVLRFAGGGMVPVRSFDSGGLWPSGTLGWNGSGRTETVTPGGSGDIHIHVHNSGVIGSQNELDTWLTNSVNRLARTGYLTQAVRSAGR
jgi:hypothetical protein